MNKIGNGKRLIFRKSRRDPRTGKRIFARRPIPIWIDDNSLENNNENN